MNLETLSDRQFQLLLDELNNLHTSVHNLDQRSFQIKGWAITIFSGAVALWADQRLNVFLGIAFFAVVLFWCLDALFKSFQNRFVRRIRDIESFLEFGSERCVAGLSTVYFGEKRTFLEKAKTLTGYAMFNGVRLVYMAMIAALLGLHVFSSVMDR